MLRIGNAHCSITCSCVDSLLTCQSEGEREDWVVAALWAAAVLTEKTRRLYVLFEARDGCFVVVCVALAVPCIPTVFFRSSRGAPQWQTSHACVHGSTTRTGMLV